MVRSLHEANPSVPVLVLTHPEGEGAREEFLSAGAAEVLPKSITLLEFLDAVRRLGHEDGERGTKWRRGIGMGDIRVLIAYEDSHRSYGEALEGAIRGLKPGAEVSVVQARELGIEIGRFDPHLVVCNRPNTVDPGGRAAWARLSDEPDEPSEFCVGGQRRTLKNPGFGDLLAIVDEAEELVLDGRVLGGC
jgi:hypothetical protein